MYLKEQQSLIINLILSFLGKSFFKNNLVFVLIYLSSTFWKSSIFYSKIYFLFQFNLLYFTLL